jgi:hypothetical protein
MNNKKITLSVIIASIFTVVLMIAPNIVKASTPLTTPIYFGINEFRSGTTPENISYAIGNPLANTTEADHGAKIWQIKKYKSETDSNPTTGNYYCVRAGVGFSDTNLTARYTMSYDFKTEKNQIASSTNEVNVSGESIAISDNIFLLTVTPAFDKPLMNFE